ncbi:MAG TPA: hypothetical protein VJ979_14360 [Actinomycetota bacterium]|nr:hypothetical protein [Actinomycetota bacterium]
MSMTSIKRPGVVTFIGVILYIQAALAAVAAIMAFAYKSRLADAISEQSGVEFSGDNLIWLGVIEAVMAVVLFLVASGIMRGSRGYRAFVAIVEGFRMATAFFYMLWHHDGPWIESGIVTLLIGAFVLWALYHEKADEFFESTG